MAFLEKPNTPRARKDRATATATAWRAVRRVVLARDAHRCRSCGTRYQVDVHHLKFRSAGGASVPRNLLCLCRICHTDLHGYRLLIAGTDANKTLTFARRA